MAWSSASSTVVRRMFLSFQRNLDPQLGSALQLCVDPHAPPNQAHPLVEADQPQAAYPPRLSQIESLPVVGDGQLQAVCGGSQGNLRLTRACMFGDIAQSLL